MAGWLDGMLSHAGVVSKQLKILSNFFLGLVALPLWFSKTTYGCEILKGKGALGVDLENFQSYNAEQWPCCTTLWPADTFTPSAYDMAPKHVPIPFLPPDDKMLLPSLFSMSTTNTSSCEYFNEL